MTALPKDKIITLTKVLTELEKDIAELLSHTEEDSRTVELDQSRLGRLSRMDAMQQQAMAEAESKQLSIRLTAIRLAIKKIEADDFGYCEECGDAIQYERLEIKPESQYCLSCQTKQELV